MLEGYLMNQCVRILSAIIVLFLAIFVIDANAQISLKGIPESFNLGLKNAAILPSLELDSVHVQKMLEEDRKFSIDNRYGVVQLCDVNIKTSGLRTIIPGRGTIWQYKIVSKDGFSLGINFKTYYLPEGASVFIYNSSKSELRGAFTQLNNNKANRLPVADFSGNNLIIEYFEPLNADFSGELILGSVSQSYLDFESVAITRIGINCPQGSNWQENKKSVCLMTFNDGRFSYNCTGSLINNVRADETPYFLTANHCISTEIQANTLVTYFNYENSICSSKDASLSQTLAGATFVSGNNYSDFSLLLLTEYPTSDYHPYYAGWDARGNNPNSGVCIHHPMGTPKCISTDSDPIASDPSSEQWTDESGKVTSVTAPNSHWLVKFNQGNTESGSSGSPLFDENKRIVGQLHGGSDTESLFGKFSLSWNYSSTASKQLKYWLDPDNTGTKILDGTGQKPPQANFIAEVQDVCTNTPVLFSDLSKNGPATWLWQIKPSSFIFSNGTDSTSKNPEITFLSDGYYSVNLKVENKYGSDEIIHTNYILAKSKLDVRFLKAKTDSVVCGCDLNKFPLVVNGAFNYSFVLSEKVLIDTKISSDTIFLSLNKSAIGGKSFDTWVKVTGTHWLCSGSDSILLHIIVQPNDNIANATRLSLGRNTGFSNQCATVETKEPFPQTSGCLISNNWCPDQTKSGSVLNNSVWFTFVAPSNGLITINTSGFNDQIAVYDSKSYYAILSGNKSLYSLISANDDRSVSDNTAQIQNLILDPLKQYWLQVDGNNAAYGGFVVDLISNSIEVFPNPSHDFFNLVISNPVGGEADVVLYDLQGRKLMEKRFMVSLTSNKFSLDLSGFAKGMYLLNVQMNGSNLSRKLIRF